MNKLHIINPVLPFPALQCIAIIFLGSFYKNKQASKQNSNIILKLHG